MSPKLCKVTVFILVAIMGAGIALAQGANIGLSASDASALETTIIASMNTRSGTELPWHGTGDITGKVTAQPAYTRASHGPCNVQCADPCRDLTVTVFTRKAFEEYTESRCLEAGAWVKIGDDVQRRYGSLEATETPQTVNSAASQPVCAAQSVHPSFDCCKAKGVIEQEVCSTPALASGDSQIAALYTQRLAQLSGTERDKLRNTQREWMSGRDSCERAPDRVACLSNIYSERLNQLSAPPPAVSQVTVDKGQHVGAQTEVGNSTTAMSSLVVKAQSGLKNLLYYQGEPDGVLGRSTKVALQEFLSDEGVLPNAQQSLSARPTDVVLKMISEARARSLRTDCAGFSFNQTPGFGRFVACGKISE